MRILITGAAGYIGSYLRKRLDVPDLGVSALDIRSGAFQGDYRLMMAETMRSYDAIVHMAGHSSVAACDADPSGSVRNNLFGLVEMVEKLNGKPLIYASSGSVHDQYTRSTYDATKRAIDELIPVIYPNSWGLRFGTVCGVSPVMRTDTLLNGITRAAVRDGVIHMRNQHRHRPVLTLDDLGWFVERCLTGEVKPGLHDLATFNSRIGGYAGMVQDVTGCAIISEADTSTYSFDMPTLGRTETLFPVIKELVAHWKQH